MIIDQLPSVGTPALTDETVTEQGQNLFKVTWQRLLALFKANTTPADIGAVDSAGAAAAAPVQSVNGMTGAVIIPSASLSDDNPQPLGTATPGTSTNVSRADHVHAMPSADQVGAMSKWELLWTNASPTSDFAAQTVSLDLSGYDAVLIEFYAARTRQYLRTAIGLKGVHSYLESSIGGYVGLRGFTPSDYGVAFAAGEYVSYFNQSSNSIAEWADACTPVRIYGIKGVNS